MSEQDKRKQSDTQIFTGQEQGHETQLMRARRQETVATFPQHYNHAIQVMLWSGFMPDQCRLAGAAETALDDTGMTVRFDIWARETERYLVDVTMCAGQVTDHTVRRVASHDEAKIPESAPRLTALDPKDDSPRS